MASYHSGGAAAAFPGSESRPEPEGKRAAPFFFFSVFVLSLVSFKQLTDGLKKKKKRTDQHKQEQSGDTPVFFVFMHKTNTHKGEQGSHRM